MLNCQKGMGNAVWMGRLSWAGKRVDYVFFFGTGTLGRVMYEMCSVGWILAAKLNLQVTGFEMVWPILRTTAAFSR